jgi:SAM-dependent methyltransferase
MLGFLRELLVDPRVRGLDVDGTAFSLAHRRVLLSKPLVRQLFEDFYHRCRTLDEKYLSGAGVRIEIGSGSGFIDEVYRDVITSDVKPLPFVRLACRGEDLPFRDGAVRAVYAINTFHHIPAPRAFLTELVRVLRPGGGAVLIEPFHGPFARFVFKRLHASESFDEHAREWEQPEVLGPFSRANQALSYVVFTRDRTRFEREFPQLAVVVDEPHTHLRYLLSGGVNFRQLVPTAAGSLARAGERVLSPLNRLLALQHTIVLRRNRKAV